MKRLLGVAALCLTLSCGDDDSSGMDASTFDAMPPACATAIIPVGGSVSGMTNGSGTSDDFNPDGVMCPTPDVTGPDKAFALTATAGPGLYRIRVEPVETGWNPMVYVRLDCERRACVDGANAGGADDDEMVDVMLTDGQTVFVIVDTDITAGDPTGGPFTLFASRVASP